MKSKFKILIRVAVTLLGIVVIVFWVFLPHPPSDRSLEKRFYKHRADIERIKNMMEEDLHMTRIAPDFLDAKDSSAWPRPESKWGITRDRWQEYRDLFKIAGVTMGTNRQENSSDIELFVYTWGLVMAGISEGYVYCGTPLPGYSHKMLPCIEHKESGETSSDKLHYRYKRITDDWYLFEEE